MRCEGRKRWPFSSRPIFSTWAGGWAGAAGFATVSWARVEKLHSRTTAVEIAPSAFIVFPLVRHRRDGWRRQPWPAPYTPGVPLVAVPIT